MRVVHYTPGKGYALEAPYDEALLVKIRESFRWHQWDSTNRVRWVSVEGLEAFAKEHGFIWHPDAKAAWDGRHENVKASSAMEASFNVKPLTRPLFPFQTAGVKFLVETGANAIIADPTGAGKTTQAIAVVNHLDAYPCVVVTLASVKYQFAEEIQTLLPDSKVVVLDGMKAKEPEGADWYVLNYHILPSWEPYLPRPQAVVMDESHILGSFDTKRFLALDRLVEYARVRLPMTATPMRHRHSDYAPQLHLTRKLGPVFGGKRPFYERYCGYVQTSWGVDYSESYHGEELQAKLRAAGAMLRRDEDAIKAELPPCKEVWLPVVLSNEPEYRRTERDIRLWMQSRIAADSAFWAEIGGLPPEEKAQRIAERHDKAKAAEQAVKFGLLRQTIARGKLKAAEEWIDARLKSGEKLVIFAYHREIQDALIAAFPGCLSITADDDPEKRHATAKRLEKEQLLIASLIAGGAGLNLQSANNAMILEFPWSPEDLKQAVGRIFRTGQTRPVTIWKMRAKTEKENVDDVMIRLLEKKAQAIEGATDVQEGLTDWLKRKS